jgi:hypothetical protein
MTWTADRPLRAERIQRDTVAEVVQRGGQRDRRGSLVLVDRRAGRARLSGRARYVEQEEHGEVATAALAVDVRRLVGRRARERFDARLDGGVDVDVVTLRLPATPLQLHPEARQWPAQGMNRRLRERRRSIRRRYGLDDGAPVVPVALPEHVPFGIRDAGRVDGPDLVGRRSQHHGRRVARRAR